MRPRDKAGESRKMEEEHAAIYWHKDAEREFYALPEQSQSRLADFLEKQRADLESSGGGNKYNLAAEWESGRAVAWDIKLRPKFRKVPVAPSPAKREKLGTHYRIEVLLIWKLH